MVGKSRATRQAEHNRGILVTPTTHSPWYHIAATPPSEDEIGGCVKMVEPAAVLNPLDMPRSTWKELH